MSKTKFKVEPDPIQGTVFISGPDNLLIGVDYNQDDDPKPAKKAARKLAALLNKHWAEKKG